MTTLDRLEKWQTAGLITPTQHSAIAAIVRKDRFSLFSEINALLYLGVLFCIGGLSWTIKTYFTNLGDSAILAGLTLLCGASFYYCFSRGLPFSAERVESPSMVFDYVLYMGTLAFGVGLGYFEFRFHVLKESWDNYLLLSAALYFFLAYRFDNRFVLSLALSTLAGWFGLGMTRLGLFHVDRYRAPAIVYAIVIAVAGAVLFRQNLKQHFLKSYLHVAANVLSAALLTGVGEDADGMGYLLAVLIVGAAIISAGFYFQEFSFTAYATVYSYIAISIRLLHGVRDDRVAMTYFVVSGSCVIAFIAWLAVKAARNK
jgi:hypothetical protein